MWCEDEIAQLCPALRVGSYSFVPKSGGQMLHHRAGKIGAAIVGVLLLVGSASPAFARGHGKNCEEKIRRDEVHLREAVQKHGEHSKQAQKRREQLERARATCNR
jgi:hypothetical protein